MNDPVFVRVGQGVRNLNPVAQNALNRQPVAWDDFVQPPAIEQLHDDEGFAIGLTDFVDGADIGVVQKRGMLCLSNQARAGSFVEAMLPGHGLDRDLSPQPRIAGAIDLAHPARAKRGKDFVGAESSAGSKNHWQFRGARASSRAL